MQTTKGLRNRSVLIEPELVPVLEAAMERVGNTGLLIPSFPSFRDMARGPRRWLKKAGVTRRDLHEKTPTTLPMTFHDLRATGITWCAVRGDDPLKIQRRAGHRELETTQRYIRLAEDIRNGFGEVFPRVRLDPETASQLITQLITRTQVREIWRGGRDSNVSGVSRGDSRGCNYAE